MVEDEEITVHHLPEHLQQQAESQIAHGRSENRGLVEVRNLELQMIQDAITEHGSQRKAAAALGISQSTISRKMKER